MTTKSHRVIVISDLHLGGTEPCMMSQPHLLADFLQTLAGQAVAGEPLELVIAGDFVDFLAIPDADGVKSALTTNCDDAVGKLVRTMNPAESPFGIVFDAIKSFTTAGGRLTIIVGNHDVEMCYPQVQSALLNRLGASRHNVLFIDDGQAYRVGPVLIEHGNRYDGANLNDWNALRQMSSSFSRGEEPDPIWPVEVSAGSEIVQRVINPLKTRYPFIDLLQPEGELTALLLLELEPTLKYDLKKIGWILYGRYRRGDGHGLRPGEARNVSGRHAESSLMPPRREGLAQIFGEDYETLRNPPQEVSSRDWVGAFLIRNRDGLAALIDERRDIPVHRLQRIQSLIKEMLLDAPDDELSGSTEQYGLAAERLLKLDPTLEAVVMGHTHLPRRESHASGAYLNCGTWADRILVPRPALEDLGRLDGFLRSLVRNERPGLPAPTFVELRFDARLTDASVRRYPR